MWHFVYYGYKRETRELNQYVQFAEVEYQQVHKNINHFLVGKHYFTLGRDYKKAFVHYRGLTGVANFFRLSYGKGAYQVKPFAGKDIPDNFLYNKGSKIYFPEHDLSAKTAEEKDKKYFDAIAE